MRIFVTGGTGFVGRTVCRQLAARHELLVLTRSAGSDVPGIPLVGNLCEPSGWMEVLRRYAPERCVHLAWEGLPDYSWAMSRRNLDAGLSLFEALRDTPCERVIAMGSCWEYGDLRGAVSESVVPGRQGIFAAAKSSLQSLGRAILAEAGISMAWLRPFFIYGPGQRLTSLIPSCIEAVAKSRAISLRTPNAVNDFVHVEDVAAATVAVVEAATSEGIYNVASGVPTRVADIANLVCRLMGRPAASYDGLAVDGLWADTARLQHDTGWRPRISLEQGVAGLVQARETAE